MIAVKINRDSFENLPQLLRANGEDPVVVMWEYRNLYPTDTFELNDGLVRIASHTNQTDERITGRFELRASGVIEFVTDANKRVLAGRWDNWHEKVTLS